MASPGRLFTPRLTLPGKHITAFCHLLLAIAAGLTCLIAIISQNGYDSDRKYEPVGIDGQPETPPDDTKQVPRVVKK